MSKDRAAAPSVVARKSRPVAPAGSVAAAYYKSLTVKLDRSRYETLKTAGVKLDKKSQEIFVEALDAYLAKVK